MILNRIIARVAARKAGQYSGTITAIKGAEPVATIGSIAGILVLILKAFNIDIDEKTITSICAGAVSLYGAIKALRNWLKNGQK